MHVDIVVVLLGAGAAFTGALGALVAHHTRQHAARATPVRAPAPTSIHVLHGDDELKQAVQRAARFEQLIADQVHARADRYAAWMLPVPASQLRTPEVIPPGRPRDPAPPPR